MKKFFKIFLFLVCCFSLITSFSQFQKTSLSKIQWSEWKWFEHEKEDLSVSFRVYSKNECKELFSKDLVSRGYQPIQIDIVNPTPYEYEINPADVSLPSEKPSKMAFKVMKSAIPRSILFKIAGLVFWPVNIIGIVDSLNSYTSYDEMKTDWQAMSIHPNEKVPPFSTLHRVIFVPEASLTDTFTIQLKNVKSGEYESFESQASLQHLVQMQNGGIQFEGAKNGVPITALTEGALPAETLPEASPETSEDAQAASSASSTSPEEIQIMPATISVEQANNEQDAIKLCCLTTPNPLNDPIKGPEAENGLGVPKDADKPETGPVLAPALASGAVLATPEEDSSDQKLVSQLTGENPVLKPEGDHPEPSESPESNEMMPSVLVTSQIPETPNGVVSAKLIPLNVVKLYKSVLSTSTI